MSRIKEYLSEADQRKKLMEMTKKLVSDAVLKAIKFANTNPDLDVDDIESVDEVIAKAVMKGVEIAEMKSNTGIQPSDFLEFRIGYKGKYGHKGN